MTLNSKKHWQALAKHYLAEYPEVQHASVALPVNGTYDNEPISGHIVVVYSVEQSWWRQRPCLTAQLLWSNKCTASAYEDYKAKTLKSFPDHSEHAVWKGSINAQEIVADNLPKLVEVIEAKRMKFAEERDAQRLAEEQERERQNKLLQKITSFADQE